MKEARVCTWAWLQFAATGELVGCASGVLPAAFHRRTVFEAELYAVYHALHAVSAVTEIWCDNSAVVDGVRFEPSVKNLYRPVWNAIRAKCGERVLVRKIKANLPEPDRADPFWRHWDGNRRADILAKSVYERIDLASSERNAKESRHVQAIARWIGLQYDEMVRERQEDYVWPTEWHTAGGSKHQLRQWDPPLWLWTLYEEAARRVPSLRMGVTKRLNHKSRQQGHNTGRSRVSRSCLSRAHRFHQSHDFMLFGSETEQNGQESFFLACLKCAAYAD
eukprot:6462538-Amphidinium_carterae.1